MSKDRNSSLSSGDKNSNNEKINSPFQQNSNDQFYNTNKIDDDFDRQIKAHLPHNKFYRFDEEEKKMFTMFNYRREPYKLKHYLYFTNDTQEDFTINYYNRMNINKTRPPVLKNYLRYYDIKYDSEKDTAKSSSPYSYSTFYQQEVDNENIVKTKPYNGYYSNDIDYINFKYQT